MNTNMQIIKRTGNRTRRILTPSETKGMREEIQNDKNMRQETATHYQPFKSLPEQDRRIRKIKETLSNGEQDSLSKSVKAALEKEKSELKEWFEKNMVPRSKMGLQPQKGGVQNTEFRKTASYMARVEMSNEFQKKAERWKYICRELGHQDDSNLENIRPD